MYVIAEAGVNHNGSRNMAFQLVDVAIEAGADAIKFQTFTADKLVTKTAGKTEYQKQTTEADESQYAMLQKLELPHKTHRELLAYCQRKGIEFLSTAFDMASLDFLVRELGLKKLKIPSGEITNGPFILCHAQYGHDLILSTGMATLSEIEEALSIIAFGMNPCAIESKVPSRKAFQDAYYSPEGQRALKEKVTLLHCTTEYPAPDHEMNLHAMETMANRFGLPIGLSDHSQGVVHAIAAVALGATIIEKHFTLDRQLPGPDHAASLEPKELQEMITGIRRVTQALGDGDKRPMESELRNRGRVRKSLVASRPIKKGELFSTDNIMAKRPGNGPSPMQFWDLFNTVADRDYQADEPLTGN